MLKNYLQIAYRNFFKNKVFSIINIMGLAVGMAVAILIGLWIWDEMCFNHYHSNHGRLGEIVSIETFNGVTNTEEYSSVPIASALRNNYADEIKQVSVTKEINAALVVGEKKINTSGLWVEAAFPSMLSLKMIKGNYNKFQDPSSILISESLAGSLFGNEDPMDKIISVNHEYNLKVSGVYENMPFNTTFHEVQFLSAWANKNNTGNTHNDDWLDHHFQVFLQLKDQADFNILSAKIKNLTKPHIEGGWEELKIHPMDLWHLYTNFEDQGKGGEGRIQFVKLFGIIGAFVLVLACINFMNLSTARSGHRAKEVGIRKTMGSSRVQLMGQFIGESLMMTGLALIFSIVIALIALPEFNLLAGKQMSIPFLHPAFWICILCFAFITGFVAGIYPAFFLSGFGPIKVLKGDFRIGKFSSFIRKTMVVGQFTVCIALIAGTVIIYQQIQFAKSRPVGYSTQRLIISEMKSDTIRKHFDALRNDLLSTGVVENASASSSPSTEVRNAMMGYSWKGKDPNQLAIIGTVFVSYDYGKTINWTILEGRDFSRDFRTDSGAFILNEAAVAFTGLKNPVGQTIHWRNRDNQIVGVVKDMIMQSPYKPADPTFFTLFDRRNVFLMIRLKNSIPIPLAISKIEKVYSQFDPDSPFDYTFANDNYNLKFSDEVHIGNISTVFCALAIFISCLGLFGLASYIAEQRTKEIAVRKVLGASVPNLWKLLCSEFIKLVFLSCLIASPLAWYYLHKWLQQYDFRITISYWVFIFVGAGTLVIALLTISIQILKAAVRNPVEQLRAE
jgi:ABC-type antimicrobial peptide transport system permease subunit